MFRGNPKPGPPFRFRLNEEEHFKDPPPSSPLSLLLLIKLFFRHYSMISDSGTRAAEDATLSGVFGQTLEPTVGPPPQDNEPTLLPPNWDQ